MGRGTVVFVVALSLVFVAFAGSAVDAPMLAAGDRWVYDVPKADGSANDTAVATVTKAEGGNLTRETSSWVNVSGTPSPIPGGPPVGESSKRTTRVETLRASDLAVWKVVTSSATKAGISETTDPTSETVSFDPPCAYWRWPLAVGSKWTVDCKGTKTSSVQASPTPTEVTVKEDWTVLDRKPVTVAGAEHQAYVVANSTVARYYVPALCATVQTLKIEGGKEGAVLQTLREGGCATPGVDDYVPPPKEEEKPPTENETEKPPVEKPPEEKPPEEKPAEPAPPAKEEDKGLFGLPGPGVLAALLALGAVVLWRRR